MARTKDLVCGLAIDSDNAAGSSEFLGDSYYFCSAECKRRFDIEPARYTADASTPDDMRPARERHEPPWTKTGGWVSPKFGSAGSGGAEYELLPEAHDKGDHGPR
jgi:YHS domain-containing protein